MIALPKKQAIYKQMHIPPKPIAISGGLTLTIGATTERFIGVFAHENYNIN